jgi:hypothetical protein
LMMQKPLQISPTSSSPNKSPTIGGIDHPAPGAGKSPSPTKGGGGGSGGPIGGDSTACPTSTPTQTGGGGTREVQHPGEWNTPTLMLPAKNWGTPCRTQPTLVPSSWYRAR